MKKLAVLFTKKSRTSNGLEILSGLVFLVICYGPVLGLIVSAFYEGPVSWLILFNNRRIDLLWHSLLFSALVAVFASIIGFLCASLLIKNGSKLGRILLWLPLIFLAVPSYIHALGWTGLLQQVNNGLAASGVTTIHLSGWGLAGWVQMLSLLPIAFGIHLVALYTLDSQVLDIAHCYAAGNKVFWKILLPLTKPFWSVSLTVLFLFSLADYSIPYLYAVNVYALEIFTEFSATTAMASALLSALPLLLCSLLLIIWVFSRTRQVAMQAASFSIRKPISIIWPGWIMVIQKAALGVLLLQLLVPMVVVFALAGNLTELFASIADGYRELYYSLLLALSTALAALPISFILARARKARFVWMVILFPLSLPPVFVGIGEIALWNNMFGGIFYGGGWMPWLAHLARFLPLAVLVMSAMAGTLNPLFMDSARLYQKNPLRRLFQIYLPLLTPALFFSFILVFVFSLGELSATLLLLPPGKSTLTLRIFNFLHYGSPQAVAGLSALLIFLAFLAAGSCFLLWPLWQKMLPASGEKVQ